ncbi:hypothetical protein [Compostimonas suwonensis]|uniref:Uncharacterized protein n=1 Tax=Compostimonas suwonensis TaxID=1048394 RepID=A0A2M9BUP4_9MICO|nr:hypothetical protein [Compostimonas suwonensis]PJJ61674.1 hypothetical protein CLV54_2622 [Compostimonas suwonensis]
MRWDDLFDDLESQIEHERGFGDVDLRAEEERLRLGRLSVRDRLMALSEAHGKRSRYSVPIALVTGETLALRPETFGKDWVGGELGGRGPRSAYGLLPLASIAGITLQRDAFGESIAPSAGQGEGPRLVDRIGIAFVLRDLCRRRRAVEVQTVAGGLHGTIDRVGRDHLDLAVHERGVPRRDELVDHVRVVSFSALVVVRL